MKALAETLQMIGGLVLAAAYIPLVIMLLKNKTAKNQSIMYWITLVTGLSMFEFYAIYLAITEHLYPYAISQTVNLLPAIFVLSLVIKYKRKDKKEQKSEDILQHKKAS